MEDHGDSGGSDQGLNPNLVSVNPAPLSAHDYDLQQSNLALLKAELKVCCWLPPKI